MKAGEEEPVVSSKDLDSIKDAIESMEESKKALHVEQLLDMRVRPIITIHGILTG